MKTKRIKVRKISANEYKRLKGSAIASFVVGLIALLLTWTGLLAFILSVISISKFKRSKGVPTTAPKVLRIIGLVFGILALIGSLVVTIVTPIIIISIILGGTIITGLAILGGIVAGAVYAITTFGPMLVSYLTGLYDTVNSYATQFGIDISSAQQIIEYIQSIINSVSEMTQAIPMETTSLMVL